jgi:hypothetical protein
MIICVRRRTAGVNSNRTLPGDRTAAGKAVGRQRRLIRSGFAALSCDDGTPGTSNLRMQQILPGNDMTLSRVTPRTSASLNEEALDRVSVILAFVNEISASQCNRDSASHDDPHASDLRLESLAAPRRRSRPLARLSDSPRSRPLRSVRGVASAAGHSKRPSRAPG